MAGDRVSDLVLRNPVLRVMMTVDEAVPDAADVG